MRRIARCSARIRMQATGECGGGAECQQDPCEPGQDASETADVPDCAHDGPSADRAIGPSVDGPTARSLSDVLRMPRPALRAYRETIRNKGGPR